MASAAGSTDTSVSNLGSNLATISTADETNLHLGKNVTDGDAANIRGSLSNEEYLEEHAVTTSNQKHHDCRDAAPLSSPDGNDLKSETKISAADGEFVSKRYLIIANVSKKPNMKTLIYSAAAHGFSVAIVGLPNMGISDLHLAEEVIGSGCADSRSRECWRNNNHSNHQHSDCDSDSNDDNSGNSCISNNKMTSEIHENCDIVLKNSNIKTKNNDIIAAESENRIVMNDSDEIDQSMGDGIEKVCSFRTENTPIQSIESSCCIGNESDQNTSTADLSKSSKLADAASALAVPSNKQLCNIIRFQTLGELKLFLVAQNIKLFGIEIMDEGEE